MLHSLSLVAFLWLIVKLLILGGVYYGLRWLADFLGAAVPDMIWKILAAILVIIGIIFVLIFLGVT